MRAVRLTLGLLFLQVAIVAPLSAQMPLADDVYLLDGLGGNVLAVTGSESVLLVDNGDASRGAGLDSVLAVLDRGPVRFALNTHFHHDHVGSNERLARHGAVVVAHQLARIQMQHEWKVPTILGITFPTIPTFPADALPTATFRDSLRLIFDGHTIDLIHFPEAHSTADAVVFLRDRNIVHTGDLYLSNGWPVIAGTVPGTLAALDGIIARIDHQTTVVPGHGPITDREALQDYRTMIAAGYERVRTLVEHGKSLEEIVAAEPLAGLYDGSWLPPRLFVWCVYMDLTTGSLPDLDRLRRLTDGPSGYADVNGTWLYYETAGAGEPVVLIHGWSFDLRNWEPQVEALVREHRVVAYDLRGFGRSALPEPGIAYSHTEDLVALLDHLGIDRAHVLGHSFGGRIAIDLGLRYPERVRSLILPDAATDLVDAPMSDGLRAWIGDTWRIGREEGVEAAKRVWLAGSPLAPALKNPRAAETVRQLVADYTGWHWRNRDPYVGITPYPRDRLEEISVPTLVMVGGANPWPYHETARIQHRRIPDARFVTIPDVGHALNLEDPEAFNAAVMEFLRAVKAGETGSLYLWERAVVAPENREAFCAALTDLRAEHARESPSHPHVVLVVDDSVYHLITAVADSADLEALQPGSHARTSRGRLLERARQEARSIRTDVVRLRPHIAEPDLSGLEVHGPYVSLEIGHVRPGMESQLEANWARWEALHDSVGTGLWWTTFALASEEPLYLGLMAGRDSADLAARTAAVFREAPEASQRLLELEEDLYRRPPLEGGIEFVHGWLLPALSYWPNSRPGR